MPSSHDKIDTFKQIAYPNPCTSELYLKDIRSYSSISIYTITGKRVLTTQLKGYDNHVIDVSELAKGEYMLVMKSDIGSSVDSMKFVKE